MSTQPGRADELVAQIVEANVRNLAATTNRIEANLREDVIRLALDLVTLWGIIDKATVVDRHTERKLAQFAPRVESAHQMMDHTLAMQKRFDGPTT
jgi:hypothetical protein